MAALSLQARIIRARRANHRIGPVAESAKPATLAEAYAIAGQVVSHLGGAIGGYKLGATAPGAPAALGLPGPFWGAVMATDIQRSPAELPAAGAPFEVEPEIAFCLAKDLPAGVPTSRRAVPDLVAYARVAMEVNRPSYKRPFEAGGLCIVADKGANRGLVLAEKDLPLTQDLADVALSLRTGRDDGAPSSARACGFDPWEMLVWFVNAQDRPPLEAGCVICTGAIGRPRRIAAGEAVTVLMGGRPVIHMTIGAAH